MVGDGAGQLWLYWCWSVVVVVDDDTGWCTLGLEDSKLHLQCEQLIEIDLVNNL